MTAPFARFALLAAAIAALLVFGAGPAHRFGVADLGGAFDAMRYGVYAAAAAVVLAVLWLATALRRRSTAGLAACVVALLLAGSAVGVPVSMRAIAARVPFMHDVTTDPADPPRFVALAGVRAAAPNGAAYAAGNADLQRRGYPDLEPLRSELPPPVLFERARGAVHEMNWVIAAMVPDEGRIEATDTTFWFGFKDDVVVRIAADGTGSRLDVRSMSRVGRSDLGTNAARIRAFLAMVRQRESGSASPEGAD